MRDEGLRAGLRDLHDAALARVTPPGVEPARRVLRRRRAARAVVASAAAIALGVAVVLVPRSVVPPPDVTATTEPPPSPSDRPSATPPPAPSSPSAGANPSGGTAAGAQSSCINANITSPYANGDFTVDYFPDQNDPQQTGRCTRVRIFWASYSIEGGVARLYRSEVHYVSSTAPRFQGHIVEPAFCSAVYYVVIGDFAIRSSFPAPTVDPSREQTNGSIQPYPDGPKGFQTLWDVRQPCPPPEPSTTP